MAIARDATSVINTFNGWYDCNTSMTWSHTCATGAVLFVGIEMQTNGDQITSVTYNGTAMTQLAKIQRADTASVFHYLYWLGNPTTGSAQSIVVTAPVEQLYSIGMAASYTGGSTSQPSVVGTYNNAGSSSLAQALTSTVNNSWMVGAVMCTGGNGITAGANTSLFLNNGFYGMADSNGVISPAGSYTLNVDPASPYWGGVFAILKPAGIANLLPSVNEGSSTVTDTPTISMTSYVDIESIKIQGVKILY